MIALSDFERLTDTEWRQHAEAANGIFIAEGLTTIERALDAGHVVRTVVTTSRWNTPLQKLGIDRNRIAVLDEPDLAALTGYHVHRGALAAFERPLEMDPDSLVATAQRMLVLEDVLDHTNVGAIMRVAAAFAFDAVLLTPNCGDPLYRRAIKVSMGTVFRTRWARDPNPVGTLRKHGIRNYALTPDAEAIDIRRLVRRDDDSRFGLILGTEGDGLRLPTMQAADLRVRIPMAVGVDSLNVAAAAAVACYELTR